MNYKLVKGLPGFPGQRCSGGGGNFAFPNYVLYVATSYDGEPDPDYQFTTIQSAINKAVTLSLSELQSVTIYIAPGTYVENITLAPHISLVGSGMYSTLIYGSVTYVDETTTGSVIISIYSLTFVNPDTTLTLLRDGDDSDDITVVFLEDSIVISHIVSSGDIFLQATNSIVRNLTLSSDFIFQNCIVTDHSDIILNHSGVFSFCSVTISSITVNDSSITIYSSSVKSYGGPPSQIVLEDSQVGIYNSHIGSDFTLENSRMTIYNSNNNTGIDIAVDETSTLDMRQFAGNKNITGNGTVTVDRLDTTVDFTGIDELVFTFNDEFGFQYFGTSYSVTMTPINNSGAIGTIVLLQSDSFTLASNLPGTVEAPVRYLVSIIAQ